MKYLNIGILRNTLIAALCAVLLAPAHARAASATEISASANQALRDLYLSNHKAWELGHRAVAVLVFPSITKGGFLVALHHGDGALFMHHGTAGYYNTSAASYGFQAGIQKFGYALFFMNHDALSHLHDHGGWELGSAPSIVVVDQGISKSLSTTNLKKGIYAFFFNQKGLMGGLGLQGSKITEIHPD